MYNKDWYLKNRDRILLKMKERFANLSPEGKEKHRQDNKKFYYKQKIAALLAIGDKCQCCGENRWEFLSIDHVNGGGNKHRSTMSLGNAYYKAILNDPDPMKYRVLCFNCNLARGFSGYCPHEKQGVIEL